MSPYLDAGFLITLLIKTPGTRSAREIIRRFPAPFALNLLHQLQAENFLVRAQTEGDGEEKTAATHGQRLWRQHLAEGVFRIAPVDWEAALNLAITWNHAVTTPAPPLLLLHPAIASISGATHFLSFDPRSREAAKTAGLQLLPDDL